MMTSMTAAEFRQQSEKPRNKFGAKRAIVDGIKFDSKREANRWLYLRSLERDGKIMRLRRQVPVFLQGQNGPLRTRTGKPMRLTVDFVYDLLLDANGTVRTVYEDAKGTPTRDYEVRRAVAASQGVEVIEV